MSNLLDAANNAYYNKEEKVITDQEFDLLADDGLEIRNFRVKTEHFQPMGSLKKLKTQDDFEKFAKRASVSCTPKLDGNSIELVYEDSVLVKAITRGDGFFGNDVTDKIQFCNIMDDAPGPGSFSRKCEAIMPKDMQSQYEKNIRNVVAGTLNRKTVDEIELSKIDVVCFSEMSNVCHGYLTYEDLEAVFNDLKENYYYEIDGLVLSLSVPSYKETDPLLPANVQALKFNKDGVDAEVGEIEINLGKHGKLTPVLILKEAVEIDGTMVQRVSASNYGLLVAAGLGVGAKIQVIKSGDIIPFVSKVIEPQKSIPWFTCPSCGNDAEVSDNGIHATCINPNCDSLAVIKLVHIFRMLDLEFISDTTVENLYDFGLNTLKIISESTVEEIASLPGFGNSKAGNIIAKMKTVKFTEAQVLQAAMVKGISSSQSKRLIDHFGSLEGFFKGACISINLAGINGFGVKLTETVMKNMTNFRAMYEEIKACGFEIIVPKVATETPDGANVVCTGTCSRFGRKELAKVLGDSGVLMQKAVNKETDFLLTNDVNSNSSKTAKANKLGVKIMSYDDFFATKRI
jgi:DNA ligase (NAD+)